MRHVSSCLETCLKRKRRIQSTLGQKETLCDLRARVRTLWSWRGVNPATILKFLQAVAMENVEKGKGSASMILCTRQEITRLRVGKLVFHRRKRLLRIVRSIRLLALHPERALSENASDKKKNCFEPEEDELNFLNACETFEPRTILSLLSPLPSYPESDPASKEGEKMWKATLRQKHTASALELVDLSNLLSASVQDFEMQYDMPLVYNNVKITSNSMEQCRRVASVPLRFCPMYGSVLSASLSESLFESSIRR